MYINREHFADYANDPEIAAYIARGLERYGDSLTAIDISIDTDDPGYVNLTYWTNGGPPFQRIRRITGYLVGDVSTWNDAKQAELRDRVSHT